MKILKKSEIEKLNAESEKNNLENWCRENNRLDLLEEWDFEKNKMFPSETTYGMSTKIWWKCREGHSYDMSINNRTSLHLNCPYCSNRRILYGDNDFETWCIKNNKQEFLKEWDYGKNDVKPSEILFGAVKKYNWICNSGHSYQMKVFDRTNYNCGCPYCSNHQVLKGYNDLESWCMKNNKDLIEEWDYEKNEINPTKIIYASKKKVWWKCKNNHSYQAKLSYHTIRGQGCPYCAGNKVLEGYNDFMTWCEQNNRQELISEWDYEKNKRKPTEISYGTNKKIWWNCKNHHSYQSTIGHHIRGDQCPYCSNRKLLSGFNDFATWCEQNEKGDLLAEWDNENDINPDEIVFVSRKKVWWKCKNGHSFYAQIVSRSKNNTGCPYCANKKVWEGFNDFKTWCGENGKQELLGEWDLDNKIKPTELTYASTVEVWWKCEQNHSYRVSLASRTSNHTGCTYCANKKVWEGFNDFKTWCKENGKEKLLDEWDYERNEIKPTEITYGSKKKIYWKCQKCDCEWEMCIYDRARKNIGCPKCNQSRGEAKIRNYLTLHNIENKHQYKFDDCRSINPLPFDFAVLDKGKIMFLIEYDGEHHYQPVLFGGDMDKAKKEFEEIKEHDQIKTNYCKSNKIPLLRIPYTKFDRVEELVEEYINKYFCQIYL